ncbi:hypothetical protein LCGC14_1259720 [marine sediment metagenome]|uniref:Lysozyme n=1 Tax=marine sediment metagenome TaxID=412755 RepID=A0A0F9L134_9ZZZZ
MASIELLNKMLKLDEGLRLKPYLDTADPPKLTIGIGRNLDDVGISEQEALMLLDSDIAKLLVNAHLQRILNGHDQVRQSVILNMAFNMGVKGLLKFRNMLSAFEAKDYVTAALEMLDSKWAEQVGDRAIRLAYMMKDGKIHDDYA